jgi:hypothetical protein
MHVEVVFAWGRRLHACMLALTAIHHAGYPGGLRERTAVDQWERDPTKILRDAVKGMLPKNKTQIYRLEKLKIFPEAQHPFTDFDLVPYLPRNKPIKIPKVGWPLPEGMEPVNPEKYEFRKRVSLGGKSKSVKLNFTDLMTDAEKEAWAAQQQLLFSKQPSSSG